MSFSRLRFNFTKALMAFLKLYSAASDLRPSYFPSSFGVLSSSPGTVEPYVPDLAPRLFLALHLSLLV